MSGKLMTILMAAVVSLGLAFVLGCESDAQTGSAIGALAGAGIGQLVGGDTKSTLMGAAAGGAIGYGLGNEQDKKKTKAEINALRAEQDIVTVWITNTNGSQTPIRLRKEGPGFVGPRGEYYPSMPTEGQLQKMYGI